jgi:hypothetical protein
MVASFQPGSGLITAARLLLVTLAGEWRLLLWHATIVPAVGRRLDLRGSIGKLERALLHLNELGDEMAALGGMARGNLTLANEEVHSHSRGFLHLFRVGDIFRPSPRVPLVVGDYIQNLRSALDHLAWELVRKGSEWPPSKPRAVQFPIYSVGTSKDKDMRTFSSRVALELPGTSDEQRAIINSYQPYHRGKWHLYTLANFSNQDKHRVITP